MKAALSTLAILALLVAVGTWYGFRRQADSGVLDPDARQALLLAEKLVDQKQPQDALEALDEMVAEGHALGERGTYVRLKALNAAGRHAEVVTAAKEFLEAHPGSDHASEIELLRLVAELEGTGAGNPLLRNRIDAFLANHPSHPDAAQLHVALARHDVEIGDFAAAERRLEGVLDSTSDDQAIREIGRALGEANLEKLFSAATGPGDTVYTVQSGDTINAIAREHGVTEELLMRANGISNPRLLRVGQRLKVPNVDFSLQVDVTANTLTLRNHGEIFKIYPVRTGREAGTTPTGQFRILNKKRNPTWRPGNGYVYMPGDPNNELGTRWMAFEGDILGIHGTLHPETVGAYSSNGCVGMTREDVEELFDLVTVGTPLTITGEQDFTRHPVIPAPDLPPPQQVASN